MAPPWYYHIRYFLGWEVQSPFWKARRNLPCRLDFGVFGFLKATSFGCLQLWVFELLLPSTGFPIFLGDLGVPACSQPFRPHNLKLLYLGHKFARLHHCQISFRWFQFVSHSQLFPRHFRGPEVQNRHRWKTTAFHFVSHIAQFPKPSSPNILPSIHHFPWSRSF